MRTGLKDWAGRDLTNGLPGQFWIHRGHKSGFLGQYRTGRFLRNGPLGQSRTHLVLRNSSLGRLGTGRGGGNGWQDGDINDINNSVLGDETGASISTLTDVTVLHSITSYSTNNPSGTDYVASSSTWSDSYSSGSVAINGSDIAAGLSSASAVGLGFRRWGRWRQVAQSM